MHILFHQTAVSENLRTGLSARRPALCRRQNLMSKTSIAAKYSPTSFLMGDHLANLPVDQSPRLTTRT